MGKRKYQTSVEEITKKTKNDIDESNNEKSIQSHVRSRSDFPPNVFDIKQFRKELATKQGQTIALTQFLQACLEPDSGMDYILEYLKSGGNSHEILRQVSQENKKNLTLATPAFHLFHLIILKVQSELPHMISITEEACRYFLNTYMPTVEIIISENSGPRHRKIILKLLTSMVTLNPDLGVEVLNQAPLTPKHLQHIVEKINYKEKDNVRVSFVHFMTSFLVEGHLSLIKALLEKQGLLSMVIPGLTQDEAEVVLMFLHILKKNVIDNTFISKSLKLKTFSHQVIHSIFKLYHWKGPSDIKYDDRTEAHSEILQLVFDILLTLFTNHKVGLYFVDNSLGTSDVNKNQNLYKALLTLKRPWENNDQRDVILQIVKKCPDLHRAIINIIEQNFEPQHTLIWERAVNFVLELLDTLRPEDMFPRFSELSSTQVASFVRFTTLPVPLLKFLQPNIAGDDIMISLYCIKVLVKMMSVLKRYVKILELNNSTACAADLKTKLEVFIPKHLPGSGPVVNLIKKLMNGLPNDKLVNDFRLTKLDQGDSLISLIDLLLYYQDIHPPFFEGIDANLNIKEILEFSSSLSCNNLHLLKFKTISLWLALDSMAVSLKNVMFKDLLLIMLEVYTNDCDDTWMTARDTLHNFLKNISIYDADENEINVMLYALRQSGADPSVIAGLIEYILSNSEQFMAFTKNINTDTETTNSFNREYLNKLFDDLMENRNTHDFQYIDSKVPSLFIVGAIHYMKNYKDIRKKLKHFISLYVANLLHYNFSAESLIVVTEGCKLNVQNYLTKWVSEPESLNDALCGKDNIIKQISESVLDGQNIECEQLFLSSENLDDYKKIDSSALIMWANYLKFCIVKLAKLNILQEHQQKKIIEYFKMIMDVCKKTHRIDVCRSIIVSTFKNSHVLDIYTPIDTKNECSMLATNFLLDLLLSYLGVLNCGNKDFDILKSYKQKNYNALTKCLTKVKKLKHYNTEHTTRVLEVIGMDHSDHLKILENIFKIDIRYLVKDNREPSLALEILKTVIDKYCNMVDCDFTKSNLEQIMNLYGVILKDKETNANLNNLELALKNYFDSKPHAAKLISEDSYMSFFDCQCQRKATYELAATLLKFNSKFINIFMEQLARSEILCQREIMLPLGSVAMKQKQFLSNNTLLETVYKEYKSNIFKILEKPHKAGQLYIAHWQFVQELLLQCASAEDCVKIFSKTHKFEVVEISHVSLYHTLFLKTCSFCDEEMSQYFVNYLLTMISLLTQALKDSRNDSILENIAKNIYSVCAIYQDIDSVHLTNKGDLCKLTENPIWHTFCTSVLRDCLKIKNVNENVGCEAKLLCLLTKLVNIVYPNDHADISQLFDMVTCHSEFLNVMLSHHSLEIKSRLVELLYVLMQKDNSVMKGPQIPVYLSAYRATRSPCDRLILTILHFYEIKGLAVNEYKPYIWGDSAANYYAVRKNRTSSLWGHPTSNQVLNLFDRNTVQNTVKFFPVAQKLDYDFVLPSIMNVTNNGLPCDESIVMLLDEMCKDNVFKLKQIKENSDKINVMIMRSKYDNVFCRVRDVELSSMSHRLEDMAAEEIYDPAFMFPLLSHLLTPGSVVSCFKLFRSGLLSVPVMALSSHCASMRAAAYHVLHRFCLQLETEMKHKNDKLLLTDFIDTLRNSLPSATTTGEDNLEEFNNPRLPAIDALYLARALSVATASHHPLYKPVNNFLIAKQFVDFTTIPDFLTLFHDTEVEASDRRYWILDVIRDGTKTMSDVVVVFKTMCLKMIMDFYSSVLSDRKTKEKILDVLAALVSIPRAVEILIQGYSFMPWLNSVVRNLRNDAGLVKSVVIVIRNLMYSLHVNSFNRMLVGSKKIKTVVDLGELKMPRDIETDLMIVLYDLLIFLKNVDLDDFVYYLKTLNLLSNNVIKLLRKKQIINLINVCSERLKNPECFKLLVRAVNVNDLDMLKSKTLHIDVNNDNNFVNVKTEILVIVNKFFK